MNLAAPLDAARRRALRFALPLAPWIKSRDLRIAVQATVSVIFALVAASLAPAWMLALSPIVLGVPHVASDVRYLVVRRSLPRAWVIAVIAACGVLIAVRACEGLAWLDLPYDRIEVGFSASWIIFGAIVGACISRAWHRLAIALPVLVGATFFALGSPSLTRLIMAHGHNVIALVLWVVLFRRRAWAAVGPLCVLVLGLAVLLSGITLPWATHLGGDAALGRDLIDAGRSLAPGLSPGLAMRVTLTFVALQAVHYAVWLRLVPQEDVRAEGTPTFAMSARSLVRDFSPLALVAIGVMAALVLAASFFDLYGTRDLYLSLAAFHAWLELVMLVFLVMARRTASSAAAQVRPLSFYKKRSKLCCSGVLE